MQLLCDFESTKTRRAVQIKKQLLLFKKELILKTTILKTI